MKSNFTNEQIMQVMEERKINRKSALKFLNRRTAAGSRAGVPSKRDFVQVPGLGAVELVERPKVDSKKVVAKRNRKALATAAKKLQVMTPEQRGKARKEGLRLYALAGRPSHADFRKVYGPKGPAMTWEARAKAVGLETADAAAGLFQDMLAKASRKANGAKAGAA